MSITPINIGAAPNDGTGDTPRDAFDKVNKNEAELEERLDGLGTASQKDVGLNLLDLVRAGDLGSLAFMDAAGLIQYGSNENGHWLRLWNGVQVCWMNRQPTVSISTAAIGGFRSAGQNYTFPVAFASDDYFVWASMRNNSALPFRSFAASTTQAQVTFWRGDSVSNEPLDVDIFAIGRWRA